VTVNLATGTASDGAGGIDSLIGIEADRRSSFNDLLNGGGNGDSVLGGLGNDTLVASGGSDTLVGGGGADVFRGTAASLNGVTIQDWTTADTIDLTDWRSAPSRHARWQPPDGDVRRGRRFSCHFERGVEQLTLADDGSGAR